METTHITPVVLCYNEAPNVGRCLEALSVFPLVLVIDSGSTDATRSLALSFPNVELVERPFDSFAGQRNFGLHQADTEWVLSLDSDYWLGPELLSEIKSLDPAESVSAYVADFVYCVLGRPLRRSLLPPREVLFRRDMCRYVDDGHSERLIVNGLSHRLTNPIHHDDRKPLDRWLAAQIGYARLEVKKLDGDTPLVFADRVRKRKWIAPIAVFFAALAMGGLRAGWRGLYYAYQRLIAEAVLALELIESDLRRVEASKADELGGLRRAAQDPRIE